jgi:hypothetical protein
MSTIPTMNIGIQGIQNGMNGLRQNGQQIASSTIRNDATTSSPDVSDVTHPLVEMKLNALQVEASAKVVKTASDMIGTLLDIKA